MESEYVAVYTSTIKPALKKKATHSNKEHSKLHKSVSANTAAIILSHRTLQHSVIHL